MNFVQGHKGGMDDAALAVCGETSRGDCWAKCWLATARAASAMHWAALCALASARATVIQQGCFRLFFCC